MKKLFPCGALRLYVLHEVFIKVLLLQKTCPAPKISGCAPVTFNLILHSNSHPNVWLFANLSIYSKLIHDNISLVFSRPKIFCLVSFWSIYKIVCTYKYLLDKLWFVLLWRRYVLFLVITIGIIISVSVILKKINLSLFLFICILAIFPKDIVPIVPKSVITSISLKLQWLSIIPE